MSIVKFKENQKFAELAIYNARDKQVHTQMRVLQEMHHKCRRHIERVAQSARTQTSISYSVPLLSTPTPLSDYTFAMNYILSALNHDGFHVEHLGGNKIFIAWQPKTDITHRAQELCKIKIHRYL